MELRPLPEPFNLKLILSQPKSNRDAQAAAMRLQKARLPRLKRTLYASFALIGACAIAGTYASFSSAARADIRIVAAIWITFGGVSVALASHAYARVQGWRQLLPSELVQTAYEEARCVEAIFRFNKLVCEWQQDAARHGRTCQNSQAKHCMPGPTQPRPVCPDEHEHRHLVTLHDLYKRKRRELADTIDRINGKSGP